MKAFARRDYTQYVVYVVFAIVFAFFALTQADKGFLTTDNLATILRQTAPIAVMAVGAVFVLSTAEIDLSIGSVVALSALTTAVVLRDANLPLAIVAGLGVGLLVGLANGLIVTLLRLPSFLVTLAMLELVAGLARQLTGLKSVPIQNETYVAIFGSGSVGPFSSLFIWAVAAVVIGWLLYNQTRFGAHIKAVGDNRQAARVSGISTVRVRMAAFIISGGTAALAGMLYAGRLQGARYTLGENDLLIVIAAVVIGGTALFGGKGSVLGALAGSLTIVTLNNGLVLSGLDIAQQRMALGAIILVAISLTLRERGERT
ncbi:MAG: ABC transporter permease [Candidatus Nanopelagicales bacterium]